MDIEVYQHSVTLDPEKCKGCTTCLKRCPTEAIRIRQNKAIILNERCIDCGECIRVCDSHAKLAVTDPLDIIEGWKYKIALPAPALYAQFPQIHRAEPILSALFRMGFDDVFEVARASEVIAYAISKTLIMEDRPKPVISSACPAIVRLIQENFPSLLDNLIDVMLPMEAAARIAKEEYSLKRGVPVEEIGAFFISPCAALMTQTRSPIGVEKSAVDGVISIKDVYKPISSLLKEEICLPEDMERASVVGIKWDTTGGEASAVGMRNALCVDGIDNVIHVLEQIENDRFDKLDYFEGRACVNSCLGGPLTVENGFVATNRINSVARHTSLRMVRRTPIFDDAASNMRMTAVIEQKNVMQLEGTWEERLSKVDKIERITAALPGLDCGSCGSPNCRALAWDIVHGHANMMNCIHMLNARIGSLAKQMVALGKSTRFEVEDLKTPGKDEAGHAKGESGMHAD